MWTSAWLQVLAVGLAGLIVGATASHADQTSSQPARIATTKTSSGTSSTSTTTTSTTSGKPGLVPKITVIKSTRQPMGGGPSANQPGVGTSTSRPYPANQSANTTPPPKKPASRPQAKSPPVVRKPQAPPPVQPQRTTTATTAANPPSAPAAEGGISIDGTITALDLTASSPSVQLTVANGVAWTLSLDPSTSILKSGKSVKLDELTVGDRARVRFAMKEGGHVLRTLEVTEVFSVPASSTGSSTAEPTSAARTQ